MFSADDLPKRARPISFQGVGVHSTEWSFIFDDPPSENSATATVGVSESPMQALIRCLTTEKLEDKNDTMNHFLTSSEIYTALSTGRKKLKGYGRLGDVMTALERSLEGKSLPVKKGEKVKEGEKILLWMLQEMDTGPGLLREHLKCFLLDLWRLSKQGDAQEVKARMKSLALFVLNHILIPSKGRLKYKSLLTALRLNIPSDFDVMVAKRMIIAELCGREDMHSVVDLHSEMMRAKADMLDTNSKHLYPLLGQWATENFAPEDAEEEKKPASRADKIAAVTLTPTSSSSSSSAVADVAVASTSDGNVGAPPAIPPAAAAAAAAVSADCDTQDAIIVRLGTALERLCSDVNEWAARSNEVLEAHENGPLSTDEIIDHLRNMTLALSHAASGSNHPSIMTVDTSPSTAASSDDRKCPRGDQISPLTIVTNDSSDPHSSNNGYGSSENGLTLTPQGVIQCLLKDINTPYVQRLLANYVPEPQSDIERALQNSLSSTTPEPQSDIERALAGSYWTIEDFEFLALLGGGSFGKVFKARLVKDRRIQVVVKVECFKFKDYMKSYSRELVDGSKVKHKNIGKVLAFFPISSIVHEQNPICMALVQEEGGDTLLKEAELLVGLDFRIKLRKVCIIVDEILDGVAALERAGLSHRDLKPENIVRGKDSHLKIIDFGLARDFVDAIFMTMQAGANLYIPPEGKGPKHDPWSVGIIKMQLMVGFLGNDLKLHRSMAATAFKAETDNDGKRAFDLYMNMTNPNETDRWDACRSSVEIKKILKDMS